MDLGCRVHGCANLLFVHNARIVPTLSNFFILPPVAVALLWQSV